MTDLRVAHASMQYSDSDPAHEMDCKAVFAYARDHGVVFLTGTEGTRMRTYLGTFAKRYGFKLNAHKSGEWVAVNQVKAGVVDQGFAGPFIQGTQGMKAAKGGHSPRGIAWTTAKVPAIGTVTVGSVHFLTHRSIAATGTTNGALIAGIAAWAREKGDGRAVVIINGDVNDNDERHDVFRGKPFTTVWDELGKWPGTHGGSKSRGSTIDISASWDRDGRVHAKSAAVLDDSELRLATDHFMIRATYRIADRTDGGQQ